MVYLLTVQMTGAKVFDWLFAIDFLSVHIFSESHLNLSSAEEYGKLYVYMLSYFIKSSCQEGY